MANEAVMIEDFGLNPVQRTIADGSTGSDIEKGTIMELADENLVTANNGSGDVFGGILAVEKVGGDGSTKVSCHMGGVFDLRASPTAITAGANVSTSGANLIKTATAAEIDAGKSIGKAEATSDAAGETIRVRLHGE